MGMAFTDALCDHADVRVALVDRRHSVSGHWLEPYPFVRLHQASAFYDVASNLVGGAQLQQRGPEEGLLERASQPEICAYYARMLARMREGGQGGVLPPQRVRWREVAAVAATRDFPAGPVSGQTRSRCPAEGSPRGCPPLLSGVALFRSAVRRAP